MAFIIKYEDIRALMDFSTECFESWGETLQGCQRGIQLITEPDKFKGETADNIRNYFNEVHGSINFMIETAFKDYNARMLLYSDGYYQNVDANNKTFLSESILDETMNLYKNGVSPWNLLVEDTKRSVNSIRDLVFIPSADGSRVSDTMELIKNNIHSLLNNAHSHEKNTYHRDIPQLKELLNSINALILDYSSEKSAGIADYQSKDYLKNNAFSNAMLNTQKSMEFAQNNKAAIQAAFNNEDKVRNDLLAEYEAQLAKERAEAGFWQMVGGVTLFVVGAVAVVASLGAATPLVAAVGFSSGIGTCIFAFAESYEGQENLSYGLQGDITTSAWNPVRDTVFGGNQNAYNIVKDITSTVASFSIPVGKAANNAAKLGTAGVKVAIAKEAVKVVAVKLYKDLVMDPKIKEIGDIWGWDPKFTAAVGIGTGFVIGGAIDKYSTKFTGEKKDANELIDNITDVNDKIEDVTDVNDKIEAVKEISSAGLRTAPEIKDAMEKEKTSYKNWKKRQQSMQSYK